MPVVAASLQGPNELINKRNPCHVISASHFILFLNSYVALARVRDGTPSTQPSLFL